MDVKFLPYKRMQSLLDVLHSSGYLCVGPQVKDEAIVYEALESSEQLPWGYQAQQKPGAYRLTRSNNTLAFEWSNGPQGIKPYLFKPRETVWRAERDKSGALSFVPHQAEEKAIAFLGARACDIAALFLQDKVFIEGEYSDPRYQKRREALFILAVNCSVSSENCFCVSAGTGPEVTHHYDLLLTEIEEGFVIKPGTPKGEVCLKKLSLKAASSKQKNLAKSKPKQAAAMQSKRLPYDNQKKLSETLLAQLDHKQWEDIAERCLSCGNCTSVCPTCFCHSESDKPDLINHTTEHQREWDSCFTAGHSYIAGKTIREDTAKRYRQWLTHKVGTWFDQFGESGCVGCGRCMTWCPVGIDITEELAVITQVPKEKDRNNEK